MTDTTYLDKQSFFGSCTPQYLLEQYGSPLYVYNEKILRQRSAEMKSITDYPDFQANYSVKANSNLSLLRIVRSEGLQADAMSPGEIDVLERSGYQPEEIFFVPNNVSDEELSYALSRKITTSLDSLDQLARVGVLAPGSDVAIRINPGVGAGHHEKVVTAGKKTKFGINPDQLGAVRAIALQYHLRIIGVNQHIGSLFMEPEPYLEAAKRFFDLALSFPDLQFVDLGGGFGIPYHKLSGEERLDLDALNKGLTVLIETFIAQYGRPVQIKTEPGRYVAAECGVLLGTVHACKKNNGDAYVGTDLGFNVLARPLLYESWHDIIAYREGKPLAAKDLKRQTIVGNICESGDILAKKRLLPPLKRGDILAVLDAGAYGFVMSSNYNSRLRPAEVLVQNDGTVRLIRRRETFDDLLRNCLDL